ncbi:MAG: hypothetical protein IPO43_22805 [Rhodoferax sp.]|nr:hypothetical protein [Rhodoferax sp.]
MHTILNTFKHAPLALVCAALLSGCAVLSPVKPGMTRDEVTARLGAPSRVVPIGAFTRWQYAAGQQAIMVDLDATGRVADARQVLTATAFASIEVGKWTRADVEREFGPPAMVDRVASWPSDILTYRWRDFEDLLFWVYLDANNVVQRTGQGLDLSRDPPSERY